MPKFNKEISREKTTRDFLNAMGVNMHGVRLTCVGDWFSLSSNSAEQTKAAAERISNIVSSESPIDSPINISLLGLARVDVTSSECDLAAHEATKIRRACLSFLDDVKEHCGGLEFYPDTNTFKIPISKTMFSQELGSYGEMIRHYSALFKTLTNSCIQLSEDGILLEEGFLSINIESDINKYSPYVIVISGLNERHAPLIMFNMKALELSKLFYGQQQNANGTITITPYFYVPKYVQPNFYHYCWVNIARGHFDITTHKARYFTIEQQGELIALEPQTCQPYDRVTIEVFDEKNSVAAIDCAFALPGVPRVASKPLLSNFTMLANPCSKVNRNPNDAPQTTEAAETTLKARL